jgi:hypothetical protein
MLEAQGVDGEKLVGGYWPGMLEGGARREELVRGVVTE